MTSHPQSPSTSYVHHTNGRDSGGNENVLIISIEKKLRIIELIIDTSDYKHVTDLSKNKLGYLTPSRKITTSISATLYIMIITVM